jgi:hypothetical protein
MHSWRVLILPHLGYQELYDQYDFSQPWNSEENLKMATQMPEVFAFHGEYERGVTTTNYLAVIGPNTLWPGTSNRMNDEVTDSHSSTIMLVENDGEDVHWMEPRYLQSETMSYEVNNAAGVSSKYLAPAVVMLDGSLKRLKEELPEDAFRALTTVNGGENISEQGNGWRLLSDGRLRPPREPEAVLRD